MRNFLERVRERKLGEIAAAHGNSSFEELRARARDAPPARRFRDALTRGSDRIVAEVKRRSPSVPRFRCREDAAHLASLYHDAGAAALSLVVDRAAFGTSVDDIGPMRDAAPLPLLVKDFVVDPRQLADFRLAGADAVLLVARLLEPAALVDLVGTARELGIAPLVECHDESDLYAARASGADMIGINNRDLDTFRVSLDVGRQLLPRTPAGALRVVESGIRRRADVEELQALGADAFLVGGALLDAEDPAARLRALRGAGSPAGAETRR